GSAVNIYGSAGSGGSNSINAAAGGLQANGGQVFIGAFAGDLTLGNWSAAPTYGGIDTHGSGNGSRGGDVVLLSSGAMNVTSVLAGCSGNAAGGNLHLTAAGPATLGSISLRSTSSIYISALQTV